MTTRRSFLAPLGALPRGERRLVGSLLGLSLVALLLGLLYATGLVLGLAGIAALGRSHLYQVLTLHGATVFYYWLYFVQAGSVLAILLLSLDRRRLAWRRVAWFGCGLMTVGFVVTQASTLAGAALTYAALAPLAATMPASTWFYLGYLLLAAGLGCLALAAIWTALQAKVRTGGDAWDPLAFASVVWFAFVGVSVVASVNAYLPPLLAGLGLAVSTPAGYLMNWSVLFHNMHYLPLISTVIVWYAVSKDVIGVSVSDVYSPRFTKAVFAFYLMLVPPTSLYHLFLSPTVSPFVKTLGSLLAIFMSIPTLLHFLLIVTAIETAARSNGQAGYLRWIRTLPWRNPAFAGSGWAVASSVGGAVLANVLIQHGFASLLSDTFFVPAYFHFFTVGTVSLTFLGFLAYALPTLRSVRLPRPTLLARLPAVVTVGLYVFGIAGVLAGYYGAPRRTVTFAYRTGVPELWTFLLLVVAVGGLLMVVGVGGIAGILLWRSLVRGSSGVAAVDLPRVAWGDDLRRSHRAYAAVVTMGLLLVGWTALTVATTLVMRLVARTVLASLLPGVALP